MDCEPKSGSLKLRTWVALPTWDAKPDTWSLPHIIGTYSTPRLPDSVEPQLYAHETELPNALTKLASLKEMPRLPPDEPVDGAEATDEAAEEALVAAPLPLMADDFEALGMVASVVEGLADDGVKPAAELAL